MKAIEYKLTATKCSFNRVKMMCDMDAIRYARNLYESDINIYESLFILMINNKNDIIGHAKISQGGTTSTVADISIICKYAVDSLCSAIVMVHNHPSGNLVPSKCDIEIKKKVKGALNLFNIRLLDSLIITEESFSTIEDY